MTNGRGRGSAARVGAALAAALVGAACLEGGSARPVGSACSRDGECEPSLACRYGRCRPRCTFDRDCDPGQACVGSGALAGVCTVGDEGQGGTGECPAGLDRGLDGACRIACSNDEECEDGLTCQGGPCQAPCNGPTALQDDFSAAERPRRCFFWPDGSAAVGVRDESLVVEPPPGQSEASTWGYGDHFAFDLRGSWAAVAVENALDRSVAGLRAFMVLLSSDGSSFAFVEERGRLYVGRGDSVTPPGAVVVETGGPSRGWWRIREEGGFLSWELREGDGPWVQLWSEPAPSGVTRAVSLRLGARSPAGVDAPGRVAFDDLNLDEPRRARSPTCPSSSLSDAFDGDALGSAWVTAEGSSGCVAVRDGALWLSDGTGAGDCRVSSAHAYALDGGGVVARFGAPLGEVSGLTLVFGLWDGLDDGVWLTLDEWGLWASARDDCLTGEIPFAGQTHWRIRHEGGAFLVGASTDGAAWEELASGSCRVDPSSVRVLVGVRLTEPGTAYEHRLEGINDGG